MATSTAQKPRPTSISKTGNTLATPDIRKTYTPNEEEAAVLKHVYGRYTAMKETPDRIKAARTWEKSRKQWEAERHDRTEGDWQSDHVVPLTTAVIETALAEMVDQNGEPLILPRNQEDVPRATVMKHIYEYTWDVADSDIAVEDVEKEALTVGTAIAQEYYFKDRRLIRSTRLDEKGDETYVEEEVFDFEGCYLEMVPIEEFFPDETARYIGVGPRAARDCIRRFIMNIEDAKAFFAGSVWDPLGNMQYVMPGGDTNYYEYYKPPQGIDHSNQVEVLWYWSKKPLDAMHIVINDVVVRMGPNIYKHKQLPFGRLVDVKRPKSFYGKGEAELLESINDEENTMRRMVIDRNHLDIDKMFFIDQNTSVNEEDLIARPHGLIPTDGEGAHAIEYGDIPQSVALSLKMLNDDATIVTGIDPRQAALPQPGTATEAAILKEAALKRIRLKMRRLEREFLVQVARLRVSNILQFYTQPVLEQIVGPVGTDEYKQQLQDLQDQGKLDFAPDGTPMKKTYPKIRLEGKEITSNAAGMSMVQPKQGFSFFEMNPDYFTPTAKQGFDIKIAAGSTLPISKPLQQSKATEMYDRLIQLALANIGYDPVKLGDLLLTVNDYDPSEFKTQQAQSEAMPGGTSMDPNQMGADVSGDRANQLVQLAMMENQMMMKGQHVPPTPYASPAHTSVHLQFMQSQVFQALDNTSPIIKEFTDHVMGELLAQNTRNMSGTTPQAGVPGAETSMMFNSGAPGVRTILPARPQTQTSPEAGKRPMVGDNTPRGAATATIPAMIRGGAQTPHAI